MLCIWRQGQDWDGLLFIHGLMCGCHGPSQSGGSLTTLVWFPFPTKVCSEAFYCSYTTGTIIYLYSSPEMSNLTKAAFSKGCSCCFTGQEAGVDVTDSRETSCHPSHPMGRFSSLWPPALDDYDLLITGWMHFLLHHSMAFRNYSFINEWHAF